MKLKWILLGILGLLVVIVAAVAIVLSTMDFEDLRPVIQAEAKKATGRDLEIAGPIDLEVSLNPSITVGEVSFANATWGSQPAMMKVKQFDLQVSLPDLLSGTIKIDRLVLVEPEILLETDADGRGNWEFGPAEETTAAPTGESGGAATLPGFDLVEIQDGRLTYRDGRSGETQQVMLSSLSATATSMSSPVTLSLEGAYNDIEFLVKGTFGAIAALEEGPFPVDFTAESGGTTVAVKGAIAKPQTGEGIDVTVNVKGESLAKMAAVAGASAPPIGPVALSAKVGREGESINLSDIDAQLGDTKIGGNATVSIAGARPSLDGALTINAVDLAKLGGGGSPSSGDANASPFVFTEDPLPLDGLHAVDANLKLDIGKVALAPGLVVSNLKSTIKLADGRLNLQPLVAGLSGGTINLNFDLNGSAKPPRLNTNATARNVDFGQLLRNTGVSEDVSGQLDGDFNLAGAGSSPRAIASGLNGKFEITRGEGTIDNRLVDIAAVGLRDILSPLMGGDKSIKLNCMAIRFDIANGLATSRALVIDTDAFTILGGGTIDLKTEKLDMTFDTKGKGVSLASLGTAFNLRGTLASPTASPDPVGFAKGAAKVAGTVIMPLPAIAALISESQIEKSDKNACVVALEAAQGQAAADQGAEDKSVVGEAAEDVGGAIEDVGEGISEGIKSLFGD